MRIIYLFCKYVLTKYLYNTYSVSNSHLPCTYDTCPLCVHHAHSECILCVEHPSNIRTGYFIRKYTVSRLYGKYNYVPRMLYLQYEHAVSMRYAHHKHTVCMV